MGAHGEGRKDTRIHTQKKVVCKPGGGAEVSAEGCARRRTLTDLLHTPWPYFPIVPVASNSYPLLLRVSFFVSAFFSFSPFENPHGLPWRCPAVALTLFHSCSEVTVVFLTNLDCNSLRAGATAAMSRAVSTDGRLGWCEGQIAECFYRDHGDRPSLLNRAGSVILKTG